jgi:starch phosphorylase
MVNWRHTLEQNWAALRFGEVKFMRAKWEYTCEVGVFLGNLDPNFVRVELYADGVNGGKPERLELRCNMPSGETFSHIYSTQIATTRPVTDYTARIIPQFAGVAVPLEATRILWQR